MNKEIAHIIKSIKAKVNLLLAEKAVWQKEREQYEQKVTKAAKLVEEKNNELAQLKQQLSALQLLQNELPVTEKKQLAKNIDKHITAIDKTITLLSE